MMTMTQKGESKTRQDAPAAASGPGAAGQPAEAPAAAASPGAPAGEAERTYSIGELAQEFAITTRAIRFYESRGLIQPRREGTTRIYSRRDRVRLTIILRGKNLGFTLEDIAEYLALYDVDRSQRTQTEMLLAKVEASIADLNRKKADLARTLQDLKDLRTQCVSFLKTVEKG